MNIAVFISGGGTTLRNLIARSASEGLGGELRLVISSRADAGGLKYAREANLATFIVRKNDFSSDEQYSQAMFSPCRDAGIDLVVMAGFLKHVLIPEDFHGRVINIHPSLIPSFCGAAMYGARVHQAALDYGVKVSGCTVHFVNNEFDNGPIILQRVCEVRDDDTAESLAARVFQLECEALPAAIRRFTAGQLTIAGRRVLSRENGPQQ